MNFFKNKIVGIDFHDYSAELVEISIKGKNKYLEAYNRVAIPSNIIVDGEIKKKEELKLILKSLFKNANPREIETKTLAITFPSSKVITHIFTFPANLNESEIKKAITYEAETIIPFSINDIYWDCTILEKDQKTKEHASQYVLFACINKQIADQYCDIFEEIETNPILFSVMPDSLRYSLTSEILEGKTSLLINADTLAINYLILNNTTIKYFFSTNDGGHKLIKNIAKDMQITEDSIIDVKEKNKLNTLPKINEIRAFIETNYKRAQKIIEEYETSRKTKKIDQILLTGEFVNLPDFIKLAEIYFPNYKIVIGDPKLGLIIEPTRFNLETTNKTEYTPYSIYFNNSIGSALRGLNTPYTNGINLLPEKLKENFNTRKKSLIVGAISLLMTVITLFAGTYTTFKLQNSKYQQDHLTAQKSSVNKMIYGTRYQEIRGQISTFNKEVDELNIIDQGLFSIPSTIEKIYKLMPKNVEITSLTYFDETLTFEISGIANNRESLLKTESNLKTADFIEEVIAPISNYDEKTTIPFQIKIKLAFAKLNPYGASTIAK